MGPQSSQMLKKRIELTYSTSNTQEQEQESSLDSAHPDPFGVL